MLDRQCKSKSNVRSMSFLGDKIRLMCHEVWHVWRVGLRKWLLPIKSLIQEHLPNSIEVHSQRGSAFHGLLTSWHGCSEREAIFACHVINPRRYPPPPSTITTLARIGPFNGNSPSSSFEVSEAVPSCHSWSMIYYCSCSSQSTKTL